MVGTKVFKYMGVDDWIFSLYLQEYGKDRYLQNFVKKDK